MKFRKRNRIRSTRRRHGSNATRMPPHHQRKRVRGVTQALVYELRSNVHETQSHVLSTSAQKMKPCSCLSRMYPVDACALAVAAAGARVQGSAEGGASGGDGQRGAQNPRNANHRRARGPFVQDPG